MPGASFSTLRRTLAGAVLVPGLALTITLGLQAVRGWLPCRG